MDSDQHIWRIWADALHSRGIGSWTAAIFETAGPLALLGAQLVYFGHPVLQNFISDRHLDALGRLLEDPLQARDFAAFLRERPDA